MKSFRPRTASEDALPPDNLTTTDGRSRRPRHVRYGEVVLGENKRFKRIALRARRQRRQRRISLFCLLCSQADLDQIRSNDLPVTVSLLPQTS